MERVLISLIISYLSAAAEWDREGLFGARRRVFHVGRDQKGLFEVQRRVFHVERDQKGLFGARRRVFHCGRKRKGITQG